MICCGTAAATEGGKAQAQRVASTPAPDLTEDARHSPLRSRITRANERGGAVHYLDAPAPPNGCGPHRFEVLNPEPGAYRCVGIPWSDEPSM
jgi:hypothetical protein